ncbi:MAG: SDR family NAD(P)-dependent oxidoreductase [Alphaproteobacteria bacterium]
MGILDGRVVIVTGAANGVGAAYAKGMAMEGAKVVCADMADSGPTVNAIAEAGGEAIAVPVDVTRVDQVTAMAARAIEAFGTIDALVNNAGLFSDLDRRPFETIDEAEWDRVMAINVKGLWLCCKAVVPEMRRRNYGKIVNVSSSTVMMGSPELLHYVTSKGAVVAFTRALARELGPHNIAVNTIAPGLTMTDRMLALGDMIRPRDARNIATRAIKRSQTPQDLVGTAVFLCSAGSDFMTGQAIVVDGGAAMY